MEFITLPDTELRVSRIGLGTWAIGGWMWGGTDEAASIHTILRATEQGINLIDTAPVYGFGRSESDDLRLSDPKFQPPRFAQYLAAVEDLKAFAKARGGHSVLALALRWLLQQYDRDIALWGARRPDQLDAIEGVFGWTLSETDLAEIERILTTRIQDPVGPEFMAPPARESDR